jgi:hypothetical protein
VESLLSGALFTGRESEQELGFEFEPELTVLVENVSDSVIHRDRDITSVHGNGPYRIMPVIICETGSTVRYNTIRIRLKYS